MIDITQDSGGMGSTPYAYSVRSTGFLYEGRADDVARTKVGVVG